MTINVLRTNGTSGAASANYATFISGPNAAIAGVNFTNASGLFTWASGDSSSRSFSVGIVDDFATNVNRSVGLRLTGVTGAIVGITNALLTIVDNDCVISFSSASFTFSESVGTAQIQINRSGNLTNGATVLFETQNGTAFSGTHFGGVTNTITFNPLAAAAFGSVVISNDAAVNVDRTFTVFLLNPLPTNANTIILGGALVTIANEDVDFQFSAGSYAVTESVGTATIIVNRTGLTTGTSTVNTRPAAARRLISLITIRPTARSRSRRA